MELRTRNKRLLPPAAPLSLQNFPQLLGNLNRQSAQIIQLTNLKAGSGSVRLRYIYIFFFSFFLQNPGRNNALIEGLDLYFRVSAQRGPDEVQICFSNSWWEKAGEKNDRSGGIIFLQTSNEIQPLGNLPVRFPLSLSFLVCHTNTHSDYNSRSSSTNRKA